MKTTQQFLKKTLFIPLFCICIMLVAQSFTSIPPSSKAASGSIEYVKGDAVSVTFLVHLARVPEKGCKLKIVDQSGEVLFEQRIKTATYSSMYKISRNNLSKISFTAVGKDFRVEESFSLRSVIEEKIEVSKM